MTIIWFFRYISDVCSNNYLAQPMQILIGSDVAVQVGHDVLISINCFAGRAFKAVVPSF
jgi:hypothetical protein